MVTPDERALPLWMGHQQKAVLRMLRGAPSNSIVELAWRVCCDSRMQGMEQRHYSATQKAVQSLVKRGYIKLSPSREYGNNGLRCELTDIGELAAADAQKQWENQPWRKLQSQS